MRIASKHMGYEFRAVFAQPKGLLVNLRPDHEKPPSRERLDQLIGAIAAHQDRQAFAELFRHFAPRIKTYLMRFGLAASAAEELAQEAMLIVWRKASYFDASRASAGTWIFTIARNLRVDQQRRHLRREIRSIDPSDEPELPLSGEEIMLTSEREENVRKALLGLSEEQLLIVRLSFFSDKPHSEIACELGIPLGTVKSRVRLALARLRNLMDDAS